MGEADTRAPETGEPDDETGEPDDDRWRAIPLLVWALATFHAALLVLLAVGALYGAGVAGNQLAALDTSIGVLAYLYLWGVTWWTNRGWIEEVGPDLLADRADRVPVLVGAAKWGGVAGLLAFLPLLAVGAVLTVGLGGLQAAPFLALGGAVGSALAAGVGVVLGTAFALLDLLFLRLAGAWLSGGWPATGPSDSRS